MQVKNNWKRPIRIGRQVIAKGAVEDVAEHLLLQPRVQKLRKTQRLIFPFHEESTEQISKPTPKPIKLGKELVLPEPPTPDNLTTLVHIGSSRSKSLNSSGIFTYGQLVKRVKDLHVILEITEQQAAEVVKDAKARVE